jgi:hypothetical protein
VDFLDGSEKTLIFSRTSLFWYKLYDNDEYIHETLVAWEIQSFHLAWLCFLSMNLHRTHISFCIRYRYPPKPRLLSSEISIFIICDNVTRSAWRLHPPSERANRILSLVTISFFA